MEITNKLKERFCKGMNVPIDLFEEPYFTERLNYLEKVCPERNYMNKWNHFTEMLLDFDNEQEYFEFYNKLKDKAIESIKNSTGYQNFNSEDMNKYKNHIKENYSNLYKEIYNEDALNSRKLFTSIDLVSANFTALRHYDPSIFNNKDNWKDFIGQYTSYKYIQESKYIRQVILGNCNPSRCITYTGWLAEKIIPIIQESCPNAKLVCFTTDELIFDIPTKEERNKLINIEEVVLVTLGINISQEFFKLRKLTGSISGFIKDLYDYTGTKIYDTKYKCLDKNFAYLAIKAINSPDKIKDEDLVFYFNGLQAKLLRLPEINII